MRAAPPPAKSGSGFWVAGLLVFLILLWLLRAILLPFVAGMAVAYFLDPVADRLQRLGLGRAGATLILILLFFMAAPLAIFLLAPVIGSQVSEFVRRFPVDAQQLIDRGQPLWSAAKAHLSPDDMQRLRDAAGDYAGTVAQWLGGMATGLVSGSLIVVNILSLLFITPVVAFYLLRDWHGLTARIDDWLPRHHAETIRGQLRAINKILAGYARGQALVCLILGGVYGVGLTLVGLDLGLVVGFATGFLCFIPYVGTVSGFLIAMALAAAQSVGWALPMQVAGVFLVGHLLESYILAPRLVGRNIGLHPVWVIFALLAGGSLFGLLGVLLALPLAAVIGVLIRFMLARYLESPIYSGAQIYPVESSEPPAS